MAEQPRKDITGRRVQLSRRAKRIVGREHWREFAGVKGTVLGHPAPDWPEWDVYWDNGLKYCYKRDYLDVLP